MRKDATIMTKCILLIYCIDLNFNELAFHKHFQTTALHCTEYIFYTIGGHRRDVYYLEVYLDLSQNAETDGLKI